MWKANNFEYKMKNRISFTNVREIFIELEIDIKTLK